MQAHGDHMAFWQWHAALMRAHGARMRRAGTPLLFSLLVKVFSSVHKCMGSHLRLKDLWKWSEWLPKRLKLLPRTSNVFDMPWNIIKHKTSVKWALTRQISWKVREIDSYKLFYLDTNHPESSYYSICKKWVQTLLIVGDYSYTRALANWARDQL